MHANGKEALEALAQRFPQRGSGNVQTVGVLGFHNALAGRDLPGNDGLFQHIIGDLADRTTLRHGFKGKGHTDTSIQAFQYLY